ncbi:MAG: hypothetical protein RBR08_16170 [Desulforegulaceae bacterium]|nr:hypothetical protein [Desulforegulaceae bacterium]
MNKNVEILAKKIGLDINTVFFLLEESMIEVFSNLYGNKVVCIADAPGKKIRVSFPYKKRYGHFDVDLWEDEENLFVNSSYDIDFNLDKINSNIIKDIKESFSYKIEHLEKEKYFSFIYQKTGELIEGVISDIRDNVILVELYNSKFKGFFEKRSWIENETYQKGKKYFFIVSAVTRKPFKVKLIRRSKVLTEKLFTKYLPPYFFKCLKRIPGTYSLVETDHPMNDEFFKIREEVRLLSGDKHIETFHINDTKRRKGKGRKKC